MNIDKYLDRKYDSANYNCAHFVCDVFKDLFNTDYYKILQAVLLPTMERRLRSVNLGHLERLAVPRSPCLALFQVGRNTPHVGVWLDGRILHIKESGVEYSRLEDIMLGFKKVRFFNVKNS